MLHLIVKQLQLSENLSKIVGDIERLEEEVGKVLMGRPPPPVMHNKSDLEKDIEGLKVSKLCIIFSTQNILILEKWLLLYINTNNL